MLRLFTQGPKSSITNVPSRQGKVVAVPIIKVSLYPINYTIGVESL